MPNNQKFGPFRPVINNDKDREESIKNDTPALFEIKSKERWTDINEFIFDKMRTSEKRGREAIQANDEIIMKQAQKHNIDPDLVRSVMFAENS